VEQRKLLGLLLDIFESRRKKACHPEGVASLSKYHQWLLGQRLALSNIRRFVYIRSTPWIPLSCHLLLASPNCPYSSTLPQDCRKCPLRRPRPPFPLLQRTALLKRLLPFNRCTKGMHANRGLKRSFKSILLLPQASH